MRGKPLDLLQAAQDAQAWLAAQGSLRTLGLEQFVGGDLERSGKPHDHGGVHAQPVALVLGDERLNNPEPFSQFNLSPAAFLCAAAPAVGRRSPMPPLEATWWRWSAP